MQAPNPQGILGLMAQGRAPQQPQMQQPQMQQPQMQPQQPMPSPNKASPMAGLGSVEDRVAAYRGNPAPLQQRYAMSQDLLDLLALQKIKSEKEAAARQMQMQMAQQQAAQGQMPTVAQQREKEVTELTKNELAQQQREQAPPPQQLMGGIAAAPGAAAAAQPQAMASGGIVAFADGGYADDEYAQEGGDYTGDEAFMQEAGGDSDEGTSPAGRFFRGIGETISKNAAESVENKRLRDAVKERFAILAGPYGWFKEQSDAEREAAKQIMGKVNSFTPMSNEELRQILATGQPSTPTVSAAYPDELARGRGTDVRPQAPAAPAAKPEGLAGLAKQPSAPPGLGSLGASSRVSAATQSGIPAGKMPGTPSDDLMSRARARVGEQIDRDAINERAAEERRIEERLRLTPEQRKVYEEGIAGLRQMYNEQYDPERVREERLIRSLIGAGGRAYGELGAAAGAGLDYQRAINEQKIKDFERMQKAREGLVGFDREAIKGGIASGKDVYTAAEQNIGKGLQAAEGIYRTDVSAREGALNREVERAKIAATNAATLAQRENMNEARLQSELNKVITNRERAMQAIRTQYDKKLEMVEMQLQLNPKDKKLLQQKEIIELERDTLIDENSKAFDKAETMIEAKLYGKGVLGGTGFKIVGVKDSTK